MKQIYVRRNKSNIPVSYLMLSLTAAHIMSCGNVKNDYDIEVKSHRDNCHG